MTPVTLKYLRALESELAFRRRQKELQEFDYTKLKPRERKAIRQRHADIIYRLENDIRIRNEDSCAAATAFVQQKQYMQLMGQDWEKES